MRRHYILTLKVSSYNLLKRQFSSNKEFKRSQEYVKTLPVFDYANTNTDRNRVYAWGCSRTGALGVRYLKKQTLLSTMRHPKRLGFGEKHDVTSVSCGFGFTAFAIHSKDDGDQIYGSGLNTDSQIGTHQIGNSPLEFIFFPQPINMPFNNSKRVRIRKISAGRAHLAVLSNEGLFILGNNAYGQCGRRAITDEEYFNNQTVNHVKHLENKTITDVVCGQDHTIAITEDGAVYSCGWGADGQTGLGHYGSCSKFSRVLGDISSEKIIKVACRSDFVMALNDKGEVFGWGNTEYGQISTDDDQQQIATPLYIKSCQQLGKIMDVASGGCFCMVLNEDRHVFVWGFGLLGIGPKVQQSTEPVRIPPQLFGLNDFSPDNFVCSIECGLSHLAAITTHGDLYTWGRNKDYCLGLGTTENQHFPLKVAIGGKVTQVSCGFDHTVALCQAFSAK